MRLVSSRLRKKSRLRVCPSFRPSIKLLKHPTMYFGTGVSSQRLRVLPFPQLFLGLFLAAISVQNLGAIQAAPGKGTVAEPDNLRQADAAFRAGYTAFGRNDLPTALRDF